MVGCLLFMLRSRQLVTGKFLTSNWEKKARIISGAGKCSYNVSLLLAAIVALAVLLAYEFIQLECSELFVTVHNWTKLISYHNHKFMSVFKKLFCF